MRILIITDSLGFSRFRPEIVDYNEIYINLLKVEYPNDEIVHLGIGGAIINELITQAEYYKLFYPDLVFIQSGIVDCSPRALTKFEIDIINRIPFISNFLKHLIRKKSSWLRKSRNITYTSETNY